MKISLFIDIDTGNLLPGWPAIFDKSSSTDAVEMRINNVKMSDGQIRAMTEQKRGAPWQDFIENNTPAETLKFFYQMARSREREENQRRVLENTRRICSYRPPTPVEARPSLTVTGRMGRFAAGMAALTLSYIYLGANAPAPQVAAGAVIPAVTKAEARTTLVLSPLPDLCRVGQGAYRTLTHDFADCAQMEAYFFRPPLPAHTQEAATAAREPAPLDDPTSYPAHKKQRAAPLDDPSSYPVRQRRAAPVKRPGSSPFSL